MCFKNGCVATESQGRRPKGLLRAMGCRCAWQTALLTAAADKCNQSQRLRPERSEGIRARICMLCDSYWPNESL